MSWLALLLVPLALYVAYRLVGVAIKLLLAAVVVVALYWWAAPQLGWPTVPELFSVFGPDVESRRIEELVDPARLAEQATGRVVDGVVDAVVERNGPPAPAQAQEREGVHAESQSLPAPVPEDAGADASGG